MSLSNLNVYIFGHTEEGIPIVAYELKNHGPKILILGGVHGDEYEGIALATSFVEKLDTKIKSELTVVPTLNVDGMLKNTRCNARGVDLNRNLPTKDWTNKVYKKRYNPGLEPNNQSENRALTNHIKNKKPDLIISLHSFEPMININGDCVEIAKMLQKYTGYEIKDYIGYPTPGSLGTYGVENSIPVVTYEIERGLSINKIIEIHLPALTNSIISFCEKSGS